MIDHISHMVLDRARNNSQRTIFKRLDIDSLKLEDIGWDEMIQTTNAISKSLISLGYNYESKVGIFGNNRPEWLMAQIGIVNLRAIMVPFYATSNIDQLKYIVNETDMELLFVDDETQLEKAVALLEITKLKTIVSFNEIQHSSSAVYSWKDFLKLGEKIDQKEIDSLIQQAEEEDIASIIYTSGTTGEPKGAMMSHKNYLSAFKINHERLDFTKEDTSMAFLPLSHIFEGSWSMFLIYMEATNVFLSNPRKVMEALKIAKPSWMCVVPRFFEKTYDGIMEERKSWSTFKKMIFDWSVKTGEKMIGVKKPSALLSFQHNLAKKLVLNKLLMVFGGNIKVTPTSGAAIRPELLKFFHAIGIFVNYGYGATETTATVSCMKREDFNLNTGGSIMPETKVTISDSGEIIVEGNTIFKGYYKKSLETAKVLSGKTFKTGDQGYITGNDYLVMTDRIKDLMKTSVGKYISPQKLELLIGVNKYIEQIVVVGDNRKYVTALIVPAFNLLINEKSNELVIHGHTNNEICESPNVIKFYQELIDKLQENLDSYEQIKKFTLLPEEFSIENKAMTNTLKIKRKVVIHNYMDIIERMYG